MTNSTEIQAVENRLIKLESEVSNTRDNLKGEISNTRDSLEKEISNTRDSLESEISNTRDSLEKEISNTRDSLEKEISNTRDSLEKEISNTRNSLESEISSIREYIKSQMDWIRPAIYGIFGIIIVLVIGVAGFIYDIKQEIGDMKQVLGGMKQSLQLIELTSELASELSGDKEFAFASENRKMLLIDSVSLENSNYQEFFPVVIHSSKSEDKPDSTLPVKSEVFPPDFGANDSDFPRDDANAVPLPHSIAFNQFPSFAFRHF